jgi:PAS domain S-box-containing protein
MRQDDSLAQQTLETLPINIAVLARDGTILFTNQSWREFGGVGGGSEMVGVNYFEGVDQADEYAAEAIAGIRSVIAGEQDVFRMEYPCHTSEKRQWFLMRAAKLTDSDQGSVVVAHVDITDRKLAELEARERRHELEHLMSRIDGVVGDVMEAVLQAGSREEIEETVCDRLVDVDTYVCAWVGRVDLTSGTIQPAAAAGDATPPAETTLPLSAADPTARALRSGERQVRADTGTRNVLHDEPLEAATRTAERDRGVDRTDDSERPHAEVAAFPLAYSDTEYGVVTVYASGGDVLDERELAVLQVLARVASAAINAIEGRRILTTDQVIELELALSDDGLFFGDIAADLSCTFQYEGSIYQEDGSVTMLFVVRGANPQTVRAAARAHDGVETVAHVSDTEDASVFEFRVEDPPIVSQLARRGAETTDITVHGGDARITLELPESAAPRTVVERLSEVYPSTEVVARRERERPGKTRQELLSDIDERLTEKQRLALQKASLGGFFEWPRDISGEELADSMGISPSTYHQHLRTAEKKVIATLFGE